MERKIGEVFNFKKDKIKVVKGLDCHNCYLAHMCCEDKKYEKFGHCDSSRREDNNDIYFELVK